MTEVLVIDTNVLEHLFNPDWNGDEHIDRFLKGVAGKQKRIAFDDVSDGQKPRILAEYEHRLRPYLLKNDVGTRTQWLRYILYDGVRELVSVDLGDGLGNALEGVIGCRSKVWAETSDKRFVYVTISLDCIMVSNNKAHITDHAGGLRRCARKHGKSTTEFICSAEAEQRI